MKRVLPLAAVLLGTGLALAEAPTEGPRAGERGIRARPPAFGPKTFRQSPPTSDAEGVPDRRQASMADAFLAQGNYRQAIQAYRQEIEADPERVRPHIGLGKALGRLGNCSAALDELWPYVGQRAFGADAAVVASMCSSRLGFEDDALAFARMAAEINPEDPRAVTTLILELDTQGLLEERDNWLGRLQVVRDDRDASQYARAVLAIRRGDIDEFDALAFFWTEDRASRADLARLEAQTWLDLDDPGEVVDSLRKIKRIRRGKFAGWLRAEATRRLGRADEAAELLDSKLLRRTEGLDTDAVRIRVKIDLGDLAGARALLDPYSASDDPEMVATRWYLARATGDRRGMARAAEAYERVRVSPLRRLEHLIPIPQRDAAP